MSRSPEPNGKMPSKGYTACARGLCYLGFWLMLLPSGHPADLALGVMTAGVAAALSVHLLPPACGSLRLGAMLGLVPHFLWESVRGGMDVAWRALSPQVRINPGFVECPVHLAPGLARNTYACITSLMPGTLLADAGESTLLFHALDIRQPVVAHMCEEEDLISCALVEGQRHD